MDDSSLHSSEDAAAEPLKPYRAILEQETMMAEEELERPARGLLTSGFIAGFGIGTSVLIMAALMTSAGPGGAGAPSILVMGTAYSVGFILIILARTDLFTEYTTLAILPVLSGHATTRELARLWGLVYLANLIGALVFSLLLAWLGPRLAIIDARALHAIAERLTAADGTTMFVSAVLAGWLMGMLSWLIAAARETISQIFFVWLVTATIGIGHLHHAILGSVEVLAGLMTGAAVTVGDYGVFLLLSTVGNAAGGVLFAVLIRSGMVVGRQRGRGPASRRDK